MKSSGFQIISLGMEEILAENWSVTLYSSLESTARVHGNVPSSGKCCYTQSDWQAYIELATANLTWQSFTKYLRQTLVFMWNSALVESWISIIPYMQ